MGLAQPSTAALKAVAVSAGDASITCTIIYTELYPFTPSFNVTVRRVKVIFFSRF